MGLTQSLTTLVALATLTACTGDDRGAAEAAPIAERHGFRTLEGAPDDPQVLPGIDVLLLDRSNMLQNRRVGLITNQTGVSGTRTGGDGRPLSTIDALLRAGIDLVALYSPEHGIRGQAEAGEKISSDVDPTTGLPIHSLYGETRKPTPEMLRGIDILVFDIQDIGSRSYTYIWTMALAMEAAAEGDIPFLVLDRPNPIGGRLVQGNVLEPDYATFVGLRPISMRHGMTVGEMARFLNAEFDVGAALLLVPIQGWSRDMWHDDGGLPWIPPSPNMPSLESAMHYPGTVLFEGTNLSVGRGTDHAFQHVGAPWLDNRRLADRINRMGLPGLRVEPVTFTPQSPGDGKFGGETLRGIRFIATHRDRYDPTRAAVAALVEIRSLHPDRLRWREDHFDRLAGTDRLRQRISDGDAADDIVDQWNAERARFERRRARYLLYR